MKLKGHITLDDVARMNRNDFLVDNLTIDLTMVDSIHISFVGLLLEIKSINDFEILLPENIFTRRLLSCLI